MQLSAIDQNVVTKTSPLKNDTDAANVSQAPAVSNLKELKKDCFEFSIKDKKIKINKKAAFIALAAATAAAAGIIWGVKTGKFAKLQASSVKKEGDKVYQNAKNTVDEVQNLIQKGKENGFEDVLDDSGNVIRRFTEENNWGVMEELDKKGTIKRLTNFYSDSDDELRIRSIEEYKGKKQNLIGVCRGYISRVGFGVEELEDGSATAKKCFEFNANGSLYDYWKDSKAENIDVGEFTAVKKYFGFDKDGTLSDYGKDLKADGDEVTGKLFSFNKDGKWVKL